MTPERIKQLRKLCQCIFTSWDEPSPWQAIGECLDEIERLQAAIRTHRDQKADDRCWMDDAKLYAALPEGPKHDLRVGDTAEMLENCKRFIEQRCHGGGPWKSYAELEAENERLQLCLVASKAAFAGMEAKNARLREQLAAQDVIGPTEQE